MTFPKLPANPEWGMEAHGTDHGVDIIAHQEQVNKNPSFMP